MLPSVSQNTTMSQLLAVVTTTATTATTMSNGPIVNDHLNSSSALNDNVTLEQQLSATNSTNPLTMTDTIMPKMDNMMDVFKISCSTAMIIGGLLPFLPQYIKIKKSRSSDGFSTYVCLTLLLANILRIAFWFGHRFELPLLIQSFVMIAGMMAMMDICIRVRNMESGYVVSSIGVRPNTMRTRRSLIGLNNHYFWDWDDHFSYVKFLVYFIAVIGMITYLLLDSSIYVESLGFVALFSESLLGVPQLLRNYRKKSTRGMSVEMVVMWLSGDIFKTLYFILRQSPAQFIACGSIQVSIDILIIAQVLWYRRQVTYCRLPKTT
uniref:Solute carrier family 66 member 2 n=1 Tax=Aceria tosichella TaxID=561515 RepID=A0A6G1SF23_9ACAR